MIDQDDAATMVGVVWIVDGGMSDDPPNAPGMSHLLEHLTFRARGVNERSVWDRLTDMGGTPNAATTDDATILQTYLTAAAPTALPRSGATGVSTATSLIVLSPAEPQNLALQANGQSVPLSAVASLGAGMDGATAGLTFWRLRPATSDQMLVPSAEHVLTATYAGTAVELTRFTTAPGYDKQSGTPPVLNAVHLWRVRYPVADIASGNCVFAEYHGFITVDYAPATVPNTMPASVVYTFQLAPQYGGSLQTFNFAGEAPFQGNAPTGAYPLPIGPWQPELDPTRAYCLTVTAFGDGDVARLPLASQSLCTQVSQLSAAGAPPPPTIGTGGGCAIGGGDASAGPASALLIVLTVGRCRCSRNEPGRGAGANCCTRAL